MLSLKDIVPATQNNTSTRFILLEKGKQTRTTTTTTTTEGQNKACLALVVDETAVVHLQFWGDECDAFEPGDIVCLSNAIFSYSRNNLVLRAGKRRKVEKVGKFMMTYVETPKLSEVHRVPGPNNSKKYMQEAVVSPHSRMFPPKY